MQLRTFTAAALLGYAVAQQAAPTDLVGTLASQPTLSNLTSYLNLFPDFVAQLAQLNATLLAPNDDAFAAFINSSAGAALVQGDQELIQAIFQYHISTEVIANITNTTFIPTLLQPPTYTNVTGGQVVAAYPADDENAITFFSGLLSNASVVSGPVNYTSADNSTGGVVYIIDQVLIIPQTISETAVQLNLTAVAGALTSASLVETVDGLTDVTVFVPDNEAFQAIGSALPNLTTDQLASILQYHVVQGVVGYSAGLENGTSLTTLQGNNVTITIREDGDVFVNGARVVIPDVLVANGVVHVIDNVLNPDNSTATAPTEGDDGAPAFEGASSASDIPLTSGVATPTATPATSEAPGATAASSSGGAAMPMKTGAVGAAALFGGAAVLLNNM